MIYKILLLATIISNHCFYALGNGINTKPNDPNITITSDFLNLDQNNLSASFKGSVTVLFDDIILKTNFLKIYYINHDNKKSIDKIEIPGKLRAIKKLANEIVIADSGEYIVNLNKLTLKGNVTMQKDDNILVTDKMIYFSKLKSTLKKNNER